VKRTLVVLASVVALVLATGASAGTITLGAKANGKTVKAKVGDLVQITLQSNASTGYAWEVSGVSAAKLSVRSAVYTPPKAGSAPGSTGSYTLTLRVRTAGSSTLKLQYVGPPSAYTLGKSFSVTIAAS
jgi:predicted secreted protein